MALTDNIVSYWKCDEASWATLTDSLWTNNLTITGSPFWTAGKINNWLSTSSWNYWSHTTFLDAWLTAWSMSFWIKTTMSGTRWFIFSKEGWASPTYPIEVSISTTNKLQIYNSTTTGINIFLWTTSINTGSWFHCEISWDSSWRASLAMKINNVSEWSLTSSTWTNSWSIQASTDYDFNIWRRSDWTEPFIWMIDEVGIWSRVLTAWEVTQLYNWGSGLAYPFTWTTLNSNFFMFF